MDEKHYQHALGVMGTLTQVAATVETGTNPQEIQDLVRHYHRIKTLAEEAEAQVKRIKAIKNKLATKILPERFDDLDVPNITAAVDGTNYHFSRTTKLVASMKGDKKPDAMQWLKDHELGDLIQETVNAQTLAATARQMVEDGEELPEELFNTAYLSNISVTKVK